MQSEGSSVQLGDLIEVKHGWPFKSELFSDELTGKGIVVAIGNFRYTGGFRFSETTCKEYRGTYPREYELSPGDILLVMTCQTAGGEILGIPAKVPNDGRLYLHNQRIGKVVLKSPSVRPEFLFWLFLTPDFNRALVSSATGTKILHTSPTRICDYRFSLPPSEVQRDVAQTLDALQERIDLLRHTNATLESIAQALFKSWFIDFDPVRAKAEGREPEGMDAATAALFPAEFEESALGLIPKGWEPGQLDMACTNPRVQAKPGHMPGDTPYIGLEHMPRKSIALDSAGTAEGLESGKFWFERNDVLFGKLRPYFHKVGLAPCRGVCSTDILVLRPKSSLKKPLRAPHALPSPRGGTNQARRTQRLPVLEGANARRAAPPGALLMPPPWPGDASSSTAAGCARD